MGATQLFEKFPENTDFGEVVVKTKVLNALYTTQVRAVNIVARHICSLAIDADLKAGKAEIVDRIAKVQLSDKIHYFFSFASKYAVGTIPRSTPFMTVTLRSVFGATGSKIASTSSSGTAMATRNLSAGWTPFEISTAFRH